MHSLQCALVNPDRRPLLKNVLPGNNMTLAM